MPKKLRAKVGLAEKPQEVEIEVPDQELPVWDLDAKLAVVGKRIPRIEGSEKVTGQAKYTLDYTPKDLPGLLCGKILRSPYPHARVERIDATKARALPGVKAVILFDKGEGFNPWYIRGVMSEEAVAEPKDRVVIYAGEEIAAVAAESEEIAEDAIRLIEVKYRRLPHVVDHQVAMRPGAPVVRKGDKSNIRPHEPTLRGDIEQGFKEAEVTVERTYRVPVLLHQSPECHVAVAKWDGEKLTAWVSTQGVHGAQEELYRSLGIPKENVRVITHHMGAGFGSKFGAQAYGLIAAVLAQKAGAPVKLGYDRQEESLAAGNRPDATVWIKLGAKKDGTLTALHCRSFGTAGCESGGLSDAIVTPIMGIAYKCPNVRLEDYDVLTHAGRGMPMRAPGFPQGSYVLESTLDELAAELKMDPLELRRKNSVEEPIPALDKIYKLGAERIGWGRRSELGARVAGPVKRGLGMGTAVWPNYAGPPAHCRVTINSDGSVEGAMAVQDIGTGTRTVLAMVAAEELGVPVDTAKVTMGDTSLGLIAPDSGGSVTATTIGPAVRAAAADAKMQLFKRIAPALKARPEDLVMEDGKIFARAAPKKFLTWKQACARLGPSPVSGHGERLPNLPAYNQPLRGAQFAEVEVDTETGAVRVVKIVAVHEAGRTLNPAMFESQVNGGVMMGMGYAVLERRTMDEPEGRVINPNLEDYKMVSSFELPEIETVIVEPITPVNNLGGKGLGEPPTVPTAGAIANAVAHALGMRIYELPLSPDRILEVLEGQKEA